MEQESGGNTGQVADAVAETVDERPWLQSLARMGWVAKGVVYVLMGLTAVSIGRQNPTSDQASPEGALGRLKDNPGGSFLLAALAIGLVLYVVWRLLTVVLIRGTEASDWLDRVGYLFSATFYAILAYTAARTVLNGTSPKDSNTVEKLSRALLASTGGRWLLLLGGAVAIGVGVYFFVHKGVRQSFCDDLALAQTSSRERRVVVVAGTVGWIGRGFVTAAVGFFVVRAAWQVDSSDARGFDRALREVATTSIGTVLVTVTGAALMVYGVYCIVSLRHRRLGD